jgi:hypothetical protein
MQHRERITGGRLSRGHRLSNDRWGPRVGHDAAECLWRSTLYRIAAVATMIVYVLVFFLAPQLSTIAYAEIIVPIGCVTWSVIEFNRFQRRSGEAVGVHVGWGAGIPSDDESYVRWCEEHHLLPYPFRNTRRLT